MNQPSGYPTQPPGPPVTPPTAAPNGLQQPAYGPPPGFGATPFGGPGPAPGKAPVKPLGPILMILGAIAAVVATFLTWYTDTEWVEAPGGGITAAEGKGRNAFEQADLVSGNDGGLGALFWIALIVALAACLAVLIAAIGTLLARPVGKGLGVLGLVAAILGLIATVGLLIGFFAIAGGHHLEMAVWLFGLSFVPVLIGAIGVLSKKY